MRCINLGGWLVVGSMTLVGACGDSTAAATGGASSGSTTSEASTTTGEASSTTGEVSPTSTGEASTAPTGGLGSSTTGEPGPTSTGEPGTSTGEPGTSTGEPGSSTGTSTGTSTTGEPGSSTTGSTSTGEPGSTSTGEPLPPPEATTLELGFSAIKQFDFSWAPAAGATHYQLLERPTPDLDYAQLGGDIVGESLSLTMPLHLRFGASYILRACNSEGCTDSAPLDVVDSLASAVGYFKASNTGQSYVFGANLDLSADGTTLAVGSPGESSAATGINGNQADKTAQSAGAVYVFTRTGAAWSQQAYVKASNAAANDVFGTSVALSADGHTLAVGAVNEDSGASGIDGDQANNGLQNPGAVYVFTRAGNAWSQQAYIKASNPGANDYFGGHLALANDGDTLAVTAQFEDSAAAGINGDQASNGLANSGAAYVFVRANNAWSQQAYIKASNPGMNDNFGRALALSGDGTTLALGAQFEDSAAAGINGDQASNAVGESGAAYVFVRANNAWSQQAYIKASNPEDSDYFGYSVALSADGDTLAVGANGEDSAATGINGDQANNAIPASGAAYMFARTGDSWSQQAYIKASNPGVTDGLGTTVALSADGDLFAISAFSEDSAAVGIGGDQANNAADASGAVYLFARANAAWAQRAYIKAPNPGASDNFRWGLTLSGDGTTLVVGANNEDSAALGIGGDQASESAPNAGAVYMY